MDKDDLTFNASSVRQYLTDRGVASLGLMRVGIAFVYKQGTSPSSFPNNVHRTRVGRVHECAMLTVSGPRYTKRWCWTVADGKKLEFDSIT
jgi:hypothetical protein